MRSHPSLAPKAAVDGRIGTVTDSTDPLLAWLCSLLSDGAARRNATLCGQLGINANELRAALDELKTSGIEVIEPSDDEVRLARPFIPLDEAAVQAFLVPLQLKAHVKVRWSVDSTNTSLLNDARTNRLARNALTLLATEFQRRGRGRQGQRWHGAPGLSLCVSYGYCLPRGLGELSGLSLMCGIAVCDVLGRYGIETSLKWPNDLLIAGKKLGGILVEVHPSGERQTFAIIGIGMNIGRDAARDAFLGERGEALASTDLESAGAKQPIDRNQLVAELADALMQRLARFATSGFAPFQAQWNGLDAYRDRAVSIVDQGRSAAPAIARGVDALGRLCLDTDEGPRQLVAGDFSLRPV
jgi:BirA family biotin operon repressor/biotin-[acetyl-CoA-carboxylase] ligase